MSFPMDVGHHSHDMEKSHILDGIKLRVYTASQRLRVLLRPRLFPKRHGDTLWHPKPSTLHHPTSIGDIGYPDRGGFYPLFNATLPRDHPSQQSKIFWMICLRLWSRKF
ncbi:hypothetical protein BD413DRAFT_572201 [Trametes elegans]|nr:hypothetical protein BD413DRAFT_572201 [Trametes elegans]